MLNQIHPKNVWARKKKINGTHMHTSVSNETKLRQESNWNSETALPQLVCFVTILQCSSPKWLSRECARVSANARVRARPSALYDFSKHLIVWTMPPVLWCDVFCIDRAIVLLLPTCFQRLFFLTSFIAQWIRMKISSYPTIRGKYDFVYSAHK